MGASSWPLRDVGKRTCGSAGHGWINALIDDDKRKLEVPRSCMLVRSRVKQVFLPPTSGGRERMTHFWRVNVETWWGKDSWTRAVRRQKFTSPIFGHDSADKYVRNTIENQEENSKSMSALSFMPRYVASLCRTSAVVTVSILSFFLLATTYKWL